MKHYTMIYINKQQERVLKLSLYLSQNTHTRYNIDVNKKGMIYLWAR